MICAVCWAVQSPLVGEVDRMGEKMEFILVHKVRARFQTRALHTVPRSRRLRRRGKREIPVNESYGSVMPPFHADVESAMCYILGQALLWGVFLV